MPSGSVSAVDGWIHLAGSASAAEALIPCGDATGVLLLGSVGGVGGTVVVGGDAHIVLVEALGEGVLRLVEATACVGALARHKTIFA